MFNLDAMSAAELRKKRRDNISSCFYFALEEIGYLNTWTCEIREKDEKIPRAKQIRREQSDHSVECATGAHTMHFVGENY